MTKPESFLVLFTALCKMSLSGGFCVLLRTEMKDLPPLLYTWMSEFPNFSYTWSLKKRTLSGQASFRA